MHTMQKEFYKVCGLFIREPLIAWPMTYLFFNILKNVKKKLINENKKMLEYKI